MELSCPKCGARFSTAANPAASVRCAVCGENFFAPTGPAAMPTGPSLQYAAHGVGLPGTLSAANPRWLAQVMWGLILMPAAALLTIIIYMAGNVLARIATWLPSAALVIPLLVHLVAVILVTAREPGEKLRRTRLIIRTLALLGACIAAAGPVIAIFALTNSDDRWGPLALVFPLAVLLDRVSVYHWLGILSTRIPSRALVIQWRILTWLVIGEAIALAVAAVILIVEGREIVSWIGNTCTNVLCRPSGAATAPAPVTLGPLIIALGIAALLNVIVLIWTMVAQCVAFALVRLEYRFARTGA